MSRRKVTRCRGVPAALTAHLPAIIDAAHLDATLAGHPAPVPGWRARDFAVAVSGLALDSAPTGTGLGRRIGARTPSLEIRGLAVDERALAHVSALNLRHELIGSN